MAAGVASLLARNGRRYVFTRKSYADGARVVEVADDHRNVLTVYSVSSFLGIAADNHGLVVYVGHRREPQNIDPMTIARAVDALGLLHLETRP